MSDNVTQLNPDPEILARWPIGNVTAYTKTDDAWSTRDVDAVLSHGGEYVQIGDIELNPADASRLAHLILAALTTLQRSITYGEREVD